MKNFQEREAGGLEDALSSIEKSHNNVSPDYNEQMQPQILFADS